MQMVAQGFIADMLLYTIAVSDISFFLNIHERQELYRLFECKYKKLSDMIHENRFFDSA